MVKITIKKPRKRKFKLSISKKRYRTLVNKKTGRKKMTTKEKQLLNDALYVKYCKCLKKFEMNGEEIKGYPICMNSVYKNRGIKPPKNASRNCKLVFNKNVT